MPNNIRSLALDMLARREHSCFELKQKLLAKGFDRDQIDQELRNLANQKLQSDERFTESYVNMRIRKGFGPIKIALELRERGIAKEEVEKFLSLYKNDWVAKAKQLAEKKFGQDTPKNTHELAKLIRYLAGKGFTNDQIREALKYDQNY